MALTLALAGKLMLRAVATAVAEIHTGTGRQEQPENRNYRTGRFTCEAIAQRRQLAAWIRAMVQLAQEVE